MLRLEPEAASRQLADVLENFDGRHRNLLDIFETRAAEMEEAFEPHAVLSQTQRRLIGAYFLHEYSFEASALFNPSIVRHPDQSGAPENGCRFILSLRAVGEGHISSLTFRSGSIAADGGVTIDPTARLASVPKVRDRTAGPRGDEIEVVFSPDNELSERVIFPVTEAQSNGIEDARFVEFTDGAEKRYLATYTAYSGRAIRSELLETSDFRSFRMTPLGGSAARNKGMALFPRKIDGRYAMIARQDNENLYLIYSDDLYTWDGGRSILQPEYPWEFVQIGNCGSPIELDDCWLLLTHGVGPVRKYCDRGGAPRQEGPLEGPRPIARAARASRCDGTRGLRAQRRLQLRRAALRRPDHPALCGVRHLFQLRDDEDCGADRGLAGLRQRRLANGLGQSAILAPIERRAIHIRTTCS